jgi:hypothetical protein
VALRFGVDGDEESAGSVDKVRSGKHSKSAGSAIAATSLASDAPRRWCTPYLRK